MRPELNIQVPNVESIIRRASTIIKTVDNSPMTALKKSGLMRQNLFSPENTKNMGFSPMQRPKEPRKIMKKEDIRNNLDKIRKGVSKEQLKLMVKEANRRKGFINQEKEIIEMKYTSDACNNNTINFHIQKLY